METFLSNDEIKKIVIDFTCSFVNISFEELRENRKSRKREHVIPRQIIFYLVGKFTGLGTVDIAEIFGKDHATFIHARKVINNLYETDKNFRLRLDIMIKEISSIIEAKPVIIEETETINFYD